MKEIIFALMVWIGSQTGFPVPELPNVLSITPSEMRNLMFECDKLKMENDPMYNTLCIIDPDPSAIDVIAVYDHESSTIYLPIYFDENNMAHRAILLHELIHHLQYKANYDKRVRCKEMLEKQAYNLTDKWLEENNTKMPEELTVGPLLRFTLTECRKFPFIPEDDHVGIHSIAPPAGDNE